MAKVKSCGNCFWSISDEDVDEILINNSYEKNESDYPEAGCGLESPEEVRTKTHQYCKTHSYIDGIFDTYVLYDDKYLAPGYFIISEIEGQLVKFAKIYMSNNHCFPYYNVRAYEVDSIDTDDIKFRHIDFTVDKGSELHDIIEKLALDLFRQSIKTIDSSLQGENQMKANLSDIDASLIFSKDVYGVRHATDFIDINIGDNTLCEHWEALNKFYGSLGDISLRKTEEADIKKILRKC